MALTEEVYQSQCGIWEEVSSLLPRDATEETNVNLPVHRGTLANIPL
jgi:hypothetical protein